MYQKIGMIHILIDHTGDLNRTHTYIIIEDNEAI